MENYSDLRKQYRAKSTHKLWIIFFLFLLLIFTTIIGVMVGSSHMGFVECIKAIFKSSSNANNNIVWKIRIPRVLAALIAGAGLSVAGLIMQTTLGNVMASPSTLGVSNAAVFGANLSIIAFAGGFLNLGNNVSGFDAVANPYSTSLIAFAFAVISVLIVLALCRLRSFNPNAVVLAGIAIGTIWTAGTTLLQFYATDVGLSAAVIWNFGDLGRASYKEDLIMFIVVALCSLYFILMSWRYNALLSGDAVAKSIGVHVDLLRFLSLLFASLITAVCVSFLGIIGFIGIICPHVMKRIIGNDHRYLIPSSILCGSLLLVIADILSRVIGNGASIPVGAITSIIGAPFFLFIIFSKRGDAKC